MAKQFLLSRNDNPSLDILCPYKNRVEITTSGTWTVPAGVTQIDLFLVGGGGGGWSYYKYGGSGCTNHCQKITVIPGQTLTITIGAGGKSNDSDDDRPTSTSGGNTSVVIGSATYSANGGTLTNGSTIGSGGSGGGSNGNTGSYTYGEMGYAGKNGSCGYAFKGDSSNGYTLIGGQGQGKPTIDPYSGLMYGYGGNGTYGYPGYSTGNSSSIYGHNGSSGVCIIYY